MRFDFPFPDFERSDKVLAPIPNNDFLLPNPMGIESRKPL